MLEFLDFSLWYAHCVCFDHHCLASSCDGSDSQVASFRSSVIGISVAVFVLEEMMVVRLQMVRHQRSKTRKTLHQEERQDEPSVALKLDMAESDENFMIIYPVEPCSCVGYKKRYSDNHTAAGRIFSRHTRSTL